MDEILQSLGDVFEQLQNLNIQPTLENTNILAFCFANLQNVYNKLKRMDKPEEATEDGKQDRDSV